MTAMAQDSPIMRRRRAKNLAVALTVAGCCVLFFVITIVRMGMR